MKMYPVVSENTRDNCNARKRIRIIIITRKLQLQATVKRFRSFVFDDHKVFFERKMANKQ